MTLADDARRLNLRTRQCRATVDSRQRLRLALPPLLLLSDEERLPDPSEAVSRLPRGSAIIVRHYGLPTTDRQALIRKLRTVSHVHGVRLIVAAINMADIGLARAVRADGLHLPEWRVRRGFADVVRGYQHRWLVTAAAHSIPAMRRAAALGVDAILLSPVFSTSSHVGARPLGVLRFAAWARASRTPVYALGGLTDRSAARLRGTAVCGFAGIGGLSNRA